MTVVLQLEPTALLPAVSYRWDRDTEILTAAVLATAPSARAGDRAAADGGPQHVSEPQASAPSVLTLQPASGQDGPSGSIEVEGADGSWLTLELSGGRVHGVQVAVWPPVRRSARLDPPTGDAANAVVAAGADAGSGIVSLEVSTRVAAESDGAGRTFHFSFGGIRASRCVRIATDLLVEVDGRGRLAGVWLLNVPPSPESP